MAKGSRGDHLLTSCLAIVATLLLFVSNAGCGGGGSAAPSGGGGGTLPVPGDSGPYLLIYSAGGSIMTTPDEFGDAAKFAYMDSQAFDGIAFVSGSGWKLMDLSVPMTLQGMKNELTPMRGINPSRIKHNFAVVNVNKSADFFDDWTSVIARFKDLAAALSWAGVEGILFDNEVYAPLSGLFNYPDDCTYARTQAEYETQARLRGKQIMEAMVEAYPTITVIMAHGPYVSSTATPSGVRGGQSGASASELMGPFFVGFLEGRGATGRVVDGGEFYRYREESEFTASYQWRKFDLGSTATACPFIPASLRDSQWSSASNISFGATTERFPEGTGPVMTPAILRTTLARGLRRCDRYAWLFPQKDDATGRYLDFLTPGAIPSEWAEAVRLARADVPYR